MTLSYEQAHDVARDLLDTYETAASYKLAITGSEETPVGWAFFYNTDQYVQTGDFHHALAGNAPILVDSVTGEVVPTGTALPFEHYVQQELDRRRRRAEGWPDDLSPRLLDLLRLVRDGAGRRDARTLDIYLSAQHGASLHTVREELVELEGRGLVARAPDSEGGTGNRWSITEAGESAVD